MKNTPILAAALLVALSGCATTGTLSPIGSRSTDKAPVSSEQKTDARRSAVKAGLKGCGMGAAMSMVGALLGGGFNAKTVIASCVVAGTATGIQEYSSQLKEFRSLQGKVSVGAITTVKEKDVVVDGKATKAADNLTLNLDAKKVEARSKDITTVVDELAIVLNKQTMPISVSVAGSTDDRRWLIWQLGARVKNDKVKIAEASGKAPVIVVSPMPANK